MKTQNIFREFGLNAEQNSLSDTGTAMDVLAWPSSSSGGVTTIFVVECKGASHENVLLLYGDTVEYMKGDRKMDQGICFRSMP